ncbi:MAG: hypothetical protein Q4F98_04340 [Lachnospiraceae bacterium]|nr:hypothetical protein [Lachnospiraceae bacterium]
MLLEELLQQPGFIYEINGKYYFLGKWICKECTEVDATDSVAMYQMCRKQQEEQETNMYFQKIRAHSDFALEIPYNPAKIKSDMEAILTALSDETTAALSAQLENFKEDLAKYCG